MKTVILAAAVASLSATGAAMAQTRPLAQLPIENRRAALLTEVVIGDAQGNVVGRLARPVQSGKKSAIRLQRAKGCEFTVQAKFDDEGEVEESVNLCKEKVIRFIE